jgi:DNA modification methylase
MQLVKLDAAKRALAEASTLEEIKVIRDQAEAMKLYVKAQGESLEIQNRAAEIKLRAERKAGELLKQMEKNKGGWKSCASIVRAQDDTPKLKDLGINHTQSQRWQQIADLPEVIFEEVIEETKEEKKELTQASMLKEYKKIQLGEKKVKHKTESTTKVAGNHPNLYHQTALEFLEGFADNSVDLIITDPPYLTDIEEELFEWFVRDHVFQMRRILKPTGRLFLCCGAYPKEQYFYLQNLLKEKKGQVLDTPLVWTYRNTMGPTPKKSYKLNYQVIHHLRGPEAPDLHCDLLNEQFSVQDFNAPDGRLGNRFHSWQKPDELAERLCRHANLKSNHVFCDPFAGTGTFLLAASAKGAASFGSELSEDTLNLAIERGCARASAKPKEEIQKRI